MQLISQTLFPDRTKVVLDKGDWPFTIVFREEDDGQATVHLTRQMVEDLMKQLRHQWAEFVSKGVSNEPHQQD